MRSLGSLVGLLVVAAIAGLIYKYYFSQGAQSSALANPTQTIDVVGVKNDLIGIAQAERAYQLEHGTYVPLDELVSSDAVTMTKPRREGYVYEVEVSPNNFRVIAHCVAPVNGGCVNYAIDDTMEVAPVP